MATRPCYPVILEHLYMHFYMHNPRAYITSCLSASEREIGRVGDEIFRRSRRHVKGSVSNRCATIHSNDCSFAARPQRLSTLPALLVPAAILLPPCRLHTLFHPFRALCCAPSSFSRSSSSSQPPLHRRKPTVHSFPFPPPFLLFGSLQRLYHFLQRLSIIGEERNLGDPLVFPMILHAYIIQAG